MAPSRPSASWRVASLVVLVAFAGVTFAPPAFASENPGEDPVAPRVATAPSATAGWILVEPALSPAVIGLMLAQQAAQTVAARPAVSAAAQPAIPSRPSLVTRPKSQKGLIPLFASYAVLQALDVDSTHRALNAGATEQNPIMRPIVTHPAAMIAFKAAATTGTILVVNKLSKQNRVAGYLLMFALNSAYLYVVANNYKIARR